MSEGGPLVLIDPATGTLRRELPFDTSNDRLSIHVAGELMIVGDGRGEIAAFDLAAAEIRWRHEVNLVDDTVVVNHLRATVGEIAALDLETGELLWERSVRDERRLLTELRDLVVDRATLDVIDADTGDELWRIDPTSLDAEAPPDHASRVSQPMSGLVVAALPYETEEQDPDTGWVSTRDLTKLVAFTAQDGSVRWQLDRHDGHLSPATLVDDRLIVGGGRESRTADGDDVDEGSLMAVDPTSGLIEWEAELRDEVAAAPIPVGDRATVLSSDSAMFCE